MSFVRVACLLVAVAVAWLGGGGEARADDAQCNNVSNYGALSPIGPICSSREVAYSTFVTLRDHWESLNPTIPRVGDITHSCHATGNWCYYTQRYTNPFAYTIFRWYATADSCPAGKEWDDSMHLCTSCSASDPAKAGGFHRADTGGGCPATVCQPNASEDMCSYSMPASAQTVVINGVSWCSMLGATASGSSCEGVGDTEIPPDADGDGTSDDSDLSPNNPGESGDGTAQDESKACGGPGQPECAADGSNEGSGKGNTSGGGGDCSSPPRSSGDAILAQIAFQTWATRCAITATANKQPGAGQGDGDGEASDMDKLRNEAAGLDQSLGEGDADAAWVEGPSTVDLDTGGLGFGGSCPAPPTYDGISIDPDNNLCMLVQIIGALVLVGAFAHAGYIIGRA